MKLVIPFIGELHPADARLIRLAEFLGIVCVAIPMDHGRLSVLEAEVANGENCLLINPDVICEVLQSDVPPPEFVSSLLSQYHRIFVHCVRPNPLHTAFLASLTAGRIQSVKQVEAPSGTIDFAQDSRDVCGAFSGLSISVPDLANHCVFYSGNDIGCRRLITVGADALFAIASVGECEIALLGSGDVVDLDGETGDAWLTETFTRFVPYAVALRHLFGDQCWRPAQSCASVIIDDPLLRPNYGFLNFDCLLRLMKQHNFATTIAFIPYNFRRSSPQTIGLLRQNSNQLSICFHGNDHTGAEFATTNTAVLNTMLRSAERRMRAHEEMTGLHCDRVMVFPQGRFSVAAMAALRSCNFDAAINTGPQPYGQRQKLTIRELAEPAVLRHSGFPLFLRKYSVGMHDGDIAFRLFFGAPILVVEHHDVFADPQRLTDAIDRINCVASEIHWCCAGDAVRGSFLQRRVSRDLVQLKAYSRSILVENRCSVPQNFCIEWANLGSTSCLEGVYRNGRRCTEFSVDESGVRIVARINAGKSERISMNDIPALPNELRFGFRHAARVFVRRRLSEMRDNYVSKSPVLMAAARSIQRSFEH